MNNPIGVIDSGVGGLSIWEKIVTELPSESTVYLADSARCPYGEKTHIEVFNFAKQMIEYLLTLEVKAVVIACNTISVLCLDELRREYPKLPIIGTVPAIKTAASLTKNNKVGILSTRNTSHSTYLGSLITDHANHVRVISAGSSLLVPLIEKGILTGNKLDKALEKELAIFKTEGVDTLVLGCSHFPFVRDSIQALYNFDNVVDSSDAIASQLTKVLKQKKLASKRSKSTHKLYTTGSKTSFAKTANILLGKTVGRHVDAIEKVHL